MATHTITIPKYHPATLNRLLGHWAARSRLKRLDCESIYVAARQAGVPRATGKRRVSLRVAGWARGGRPADPDAYWKSLLDALVAAGLLLDDDARGVELGPVTIERADVNVTEITLEDLY